MSRIGNSPIRFGSAIRVTLLDGGLQVKGPKGELFEPLPEDITAEVGDGVLRLRRPDDRKVSRARHGLARALAQNMVTGVSEGFSKQLQVIGVGFRVAASGAKLNLTVGLSHSVVMPVPKGLKVSVNEDVIKVEGCSRQDVGHFAAEIRRVRPPEPYKGKGIRYLDERVRRKVGKTAAS